MIAHQILTIWLSQVIKYGHFVLLGQATNPKRLYLRSWEWDSTTNLPNVPVLYINITKTMVSKNIKICLQGLCSNIRVQNLDLVKRKSRALHFEDKRWADCPGHVMYMTINIYQHEEQDKRQKLTIIFMYNSCICWTQSDCEETTLAFKCLFQPSNKLTSS